VAKRPKGAPGIYELEPGLFKVVVSLGRDGTGRYRQQARSVRGTLREAKALRARGLTDAADGKLIPRTGVTSGRCSSGGSSTSRRSVGARPRSRPIE
jgi:hypothetical protein